MRNQDISEFNIGDKIKCMSGTYEVLDIKFKVNSKLEHYDEYSICQDIDTGHIQNITWHKNTNFTLVD